MTTMKGKTFKQLMLYNYRYIFVYSLIALFVCYFLFWQLSSIGPGLSVEETHVAAVHTNARLSLQEPLYPLFAKLQIVSLYIFGANSYSIRVPSVLIGVATLLFLYQILKKWFGKPTALLSTALVATADWFLFTARLANGAIEFSFWIVLALLSITKLIERKQGYSIILAASLVSLLFIPFGIYVSTGLIIGILSCRVIRERVFEVKISLKLLCSLIILIGSSFFAYSVLRDHNFAKTILGISAGIPNLSEYIKAVLTNGSSVVAVVPATNPVNGPNGVFFVRFFELTFVLFGVFMFYKTRINRLNLILICISIALLILSGLNGQGANSLLIVPAVIFITAGLRYFIHRWQKTFPKNPYARMAAFLPILGLLLLTAVQHHQSYFVLWPRQTATVNIFSFDLALASNELNKNDSSKNCSIITQDNDIRLLLETNDYKCFTSFATEPRLLDSGEKQVISPKLVTSSSQIGNTSARALTSPNSQSSVRWIVKTQSN